MATANFFQRQKEAKTNTIYLVFCFACALVGTVLLTWSSLSLLCGLCMTHDAKHLVINYAEPLLLVPVSVVTVAIIIIGWLIKTFELSSGGKSVANMFRATIVQPSTTDVAEKTLLNIVEEMSIAAQTPMPQVYVIDNEHSINAFAAGYSRGDTVICVTRGALEYLNRDELQGVIAHEYSHILNGDMALNMQLLAMVFGITSISTVGVCFIKVVTNCSSSNDDSRFAIFLFIIGAILWCVGCIGAFTGGCLQAAISRERESLADAAATQFTRNPEGLKNALLKIIGFGSSMRSGCAGQVNHFLFANAGGSAFATHPAIEARIKALDPSFDVDHLADAVRNVMAEQRAKEEADETSAAAREIAARESAAAKMVSALGGTAQGARSQAGEIPGVPLLAAVAAAAAAGSVPTATASPLEALGIAEPIRRSARNLLGANALIFGMLLSIAPATRQNQMEQIAQSNAMVGEELKRLLPEIDRLTDSNKLALVCVAVSTLRGMSLQQYQDFLPVFKQLIGADGHMDLFEYMLSKSVERNLDNYYFAKQRRSLIIRLDEVAEPVRVVLSAVAHQMSDEHQVVAAYKQAVSKISCLADSMPVPAGQCQPQQLDQPLQEISKGCYDIRMAVINAACGIASFDGVVTTEECQLLNALADALEARLPNLLTAKQA